MHKSPVIPHHTQHKSYFHLLQVAFNITFKGVLSNLWSATLKEFEATSVELHAFVCTSLVYNLWQLLPFHRL